VLFLLDTGYRMMASEGGKSHFDRAFEAMLSLAWVALKQGDRVGVRTWGPDERWIPPRRGKSGFPHLVQGLYDVYPSPEASSPATILSQVLPRLARRTLIILLTNFREEDNEDMRRFIPILRSRHLLCTVWMREGVVDELSTRIATTHSNALETMMADVGGRGHTHDRYCSGTTDRPYDRAILGYQDKGIAVSYCALFINTGSIQADKNHLVSSLGVI
jgi:uncharacterized protein (DUF58 family)